MEAINRDQQVALCIKNTIRTKGLIQRMVAERAGFTPNQFCDMLNGRKIIKTSYIPDIANAIGVDIAELFPQSWN